VSASSNGDRRAARLEEVAPQLVSELLQRCGEARIRVAGTSMLPSVQPADVLVIRPVDIACVKCDDVVLFTVSSRLFAHRVVRIEGGVSRTLITRGDNHRHDDPPVTSGQLVGRVEGQLRGGRPTVMSGPPPRRSSNRLSAAWLRLLGRTAEPLRRTAHDPIDVRER
jgi:hypothetical protein